MCIQANAASASMCIRAIPDIGRTLAIVADAVK
jgi:hypothetical protein